MKPDFKALNKAEIEVVSKPLFKSDLEEISAALKLKRANRVLAIPPVKTSRTFPKR